MGVGIGLILLGFPLAVLAWVLVAIKLKQKNYGGVSRQLAGFSMGFVVWWTCAIPGVILSHVEAAEAATTKAKETQSIPNVSE